MWLKQPKCFYNSSFDFAYVATVYVIVFALSSLKFLTNVGYIRLFLRHLTVSVVM